MIHITPVILCGGSGTRLWPLSRAGFPKQFLSLTGNESLFQQAAQRLVAASADDIQVAKPLIVTGEEHRFLASEQLREVSIELGAALLEPVGRNTAPALTLAALAAQQNGADPVLLVTPADQTVVNQVAFTVAMQNAIREAATGSIVILGITPDRPETGYGYIQASAGTNEAAMSVQRFVEKPDASTARQYLDEGGYYWNAGMFVLKASVWIPVYGDGLQIRDWLYVKDHCSAIRRVLEAGRLGETYNVGGWNEKPNIEIVHTVCALLDELRPKADGTSYATQITYVTDRPGHDRRYAIDARKLERELGWKPAETFETGMLRDAAASDPRWSIAILRYFNPVGAHESGQIGEDPNGIPNNLLPYIAQVAVGKLPELAVFGNDYPTPDGTGVRDYIHVVDLAEGHLCALRALEALQSRTGAHVWNLGTGQGYSVLEMVRAFEAASGKPVPYRVAPRRPGDIATCYADPAKAERELGWKARRGLDEMMRDAWRWQSMNPDGYR